VFGIQDHSVQQCDLCGLVFLNPQPGDDVLSHIRSVPHRRKNNQAGAYLDQIAQYTGAATGTLLDVGCGQGELLFEAAARGYIVRGVEASPEAAQAANGQLRRQAVVCGSVEDAAFPTGTFDFCVCNDVIDHVRSPIDLLAQIHRVLRPGGVLLLATSAVEVTQGGGFSRRPQDVTAGRLHYFNRSTMANVLARSGFRGVEVSSHHQELTFIARAAPKRDRPLLSVIVPAYNEGKTIRWILDRLIAKQLDDLDKEIIIVEGNSTDGTREAALEYQQVRGVKVVLSDRPRGKGHAVREGLACATGDFVLIQDADDEYDIDDYDKLLEPLRRYQQAFVLGSRHKGHWRMRNFGGQASLTAFMNVGHIFLTELFNVLYGQRLSDPWTMYKVFRRDCLHRMNLTCNRFDFDVELVAKLVRRGFTPLEVPVTYRSRSFADGKKINMVRDPWSWIWACLKYRVATIDQPRSATD
jgi:2-polyprenyl-3-methyl-5-hydroxy-6-metoxy-1,4-benzoquinol methylase